MAGRFPDQKFQLVQRNLVPLLQQAVGTECNRGTDGGGTVVFLGIGQQRNFFGGGH